MGKDRQSIASRVFSHGESVYEAATGYHDAVTSWSKHRLPELDARQLRTTSLLIFVVATGVLTVGTLFTVDDLVTLVFNGPGEIWTGGNAVNNEGRCISSGRRLLGPLEATECQNVIVAGLARIAFAFVLGETLHRIAQELVDYSKAAASTGLVLYVGLVVWFYGRPNLVAWIIFSEFVLILYYGVALSWSLLSQ
jgi:hypothetical protein